MKVHHTPSGEHTHTHTLTHSHTHPVVVVLVLAVLEAGVAEHTGGVGRAVLACICGLVVLEYSPAYTRRGLLQILEVSATMRRAGEEKLRVRVRHSV